MMVSRSQSFIWCSCPPLIPLPVSGVYAAALAAVGGGKLHAVAAGVFARLRLLPRHHVLLHLLLLQSRARPLRQARWPAAARQPGMRFFAFA